MRRFAWLLTIIAIAQAIAGQAFAQATALPGSSVMISPVGGGFLTPRPLVSQDLYQQGSCASGNLFYNSAGAVACLPGGLNNQVLRALTGAAPAFGGLTAQDLYQGGSCPSGQLFYNNAGSISCETVGAAGAVTSVGQTFTGGIITVAGSPITTSGTLALTVAGTSGGVPYFNSGSSWATSGALAAGQFVQGGGAGAAPSTFALGGDCTFASPNITCTKTGGTSFGTLATLNAAPAGTLTGATLAAGVTASSLTSVGTLTALGVSGLATFTGSIAHNPTTAFASGVVPGIFQQYAATGSSGTATSAAINVLDLTSDNLTVNGAPGNASLVLLSVYDLAFGGAAARGGRIAGDFDITQSAVTESTHTFRAYVGLHSTVITATGDGGGVGTEKGQYYGMWASTILQASATRVQSVQGLEVDMQALSGSSVLYKAGITVGGASGGGVDAVQGSTVDTMIWFGSCGTCVGSKDALLFGSNLGTTGIATTGAVLEFYPVAATIGKGIDLTGGGNLTITNNAWTSPGATIGGTGQFGSTAGAYGFTSVGTHSTGGFNDQSTTPYGLALQGTYSGAAAYITSKIDFHFAGTAGACTIAGKIPVLINGVNQFLAYC